MTNDNIDRYVDTENGAPVIADLAARAAVAENAVERIDITGDRELIRLLHFGDVHETLLDPDAFADQPRWKEGTVRPATIQSFIRYVKAHQEESTAVWVDADAGSFVAVIDDHQAGVDTAAFGLAGWGDHRAILTLKQHPDLVHWLSRDGKLLSQLDFAEHIEQGVHNVVTPSAADLLEVAQTLHGTRNVDWKAGQRIADGQIQFRYEEQVQGRAGTTGELEIPREFTLAIPPFVGMDAAPFTANFRWRLNDGHVSLGYRLVRPDVVLRHAVDSLVTDVEDALDLEAFMGTARAGRGAGPSIGVNIGASRR